MILTYDLIPQVLAGSTDIVGTITAPGGIPNTAAQTGTLLSVVIKLLVAVAGIFALWQFLSGGLDYITSDGDKTKVSSATNKFTMAFMGLALIAGSFIIIAIAGFLFYGNPGIFLNPKLETL